MAARKGRAVKGRSAKARSEAAKRRSEAAKRGWETRRKRAAERQRELERRRRSEAAKRGWEKRRQREAEKKRPPIPAAPNLEDWLEGYEDWNLWFTGADEWEEDEWEGTASYEESH